MRSNLLKYFKATFCPVVSVFTGLWFRIQQLAYCTIILLINQIVIAICCKTSQLAPLIFPFFVLEQLVLRFALHLKFDFAHNFVL